MCDDPVYQPIYVNRKLVSHSMRPCGQCIGCRIDSMLVYSQRCSNEFIKGRSAFVTLTYDDNHLRYHDKAIMPSLCRLDVHKYIDNIRHQVKKMEVLPYGCRKDFSFFLAGEYGDSFERPHYHLLCFGLDFADCKDIFQKSWKFGSIKSLPILQGGIRYVVDYMTKSVTGDEAVKQYDEKFRERPFKMFSKGLGSDFFYFHRDEISKTGHIKIGMRKCSIPTYYKNLFMSFDSDDFAEYEKTHFDSIRQVLDEVKRSGFSDYQSYLDYSRRANELASETRFLSFGKACLPKFKNRTSSYDVSLIYKSLEVNK